MSTLLPCNTVYEEADIHYTVGTFDLVIVYLFWPVLFVDWMTVSQCLSIPLLYFSFNWKWSVFYLRERINGHKHTPYAMNSRISTRIYIIYCAVLCPKLQNLNNYRNIIYNINAFCIWIWTYINKVVHVQNVIRHIVLLNVHASRVHTSTPHHIREYGLYGNVNIFTMHIGCFVLLYGYSEQQQHIRICIMIIIAAIKYVKCTQAPQSHSNIYENLCWMLRRSKSWFFIIHISYRI